MQTLHYSIRITASKEKVWDTMIDEKLYREWTYFFMPGSHYVGSWETGSKILFVAPDETGKKESGMVSTIVESRPYEFISIKHLGLVEDGVEDITSEATKPWAGGLENYTFREVNGITELLVDMDSDDNLVDMFNQVWPKALHKLKELSEL